MKNIHINLLVTLLLIGTSGFGQSIITLDQVIEIAKNGSLSSQQAENKKENYYWQYKQFKSVYLPQLVLNGNLPNYNRSINPITQPDGSTEFRAVSMSTSNVNLNLEQNIGLTGGKIYMGAQMQRIDNFEGANTGTSYAGQPFMIGFYQPLFNFNPLKWDKQIEPLRYEESLKQYAEELEMIAYETTELYFNLLIAQISYDVATTNLANNDTIYKIGQGRYNLGKIAENELLQLELNVLTADRDLQSANLDVERSRLTLFNYLNIPENTISQLSTPAEIPDVTISADVAVIQARENKQQYINYKRRKLEAERDVAKAKGESGLQINMSGQFGLTQQATTPSGVYESPNSQQQFQLGFNIPILDWGRRKSKVETAISNQRLVQSTIQQEEELFSQNIYLLARQIPIIRASALSTEKARSIAEKSYEIARRRYMVGKISVTDLNIALKDKDQKTKEYLAALKEYWLSYYRLRMFTLYDFKSNQKIGGN
ncbi:TolC family protein [Flammeovirga kamogawensis]|uniref:TolC family protein n=1 Tax=Flammeovirga kamogawensis TaxID=373891 RepID=A0ABX8GW10_9BACT|nr:TolC family protein [Flammeovirga kamogawensis]MBB6459814.1 outer membrane protein TolC [Flammeovirga kamogawensis]QWG07130.1 TolC family protein [Flammeovirga kamogawensis]TRX68952.1 TolC family protein [Flammeovirga kamogawensis]